MTTLETLKWDGKKSGKVTLDLAVAKETSSADLEPKFLISRRSS